jgi:hypothetical protein
MAVLDSVYNFTSELDLKDRDVGALFGRLKAEVCDPTGCTLALVDHMAWATKENRSRSRAYGDVFKGAAVRAGLYIEVDRSKLYVEARGNNIRGFPRKPAYWDVDLLELRLADTSRQEEADEELDERVRGWLIEHPEQHSTTALRKAITGRNERIDEALERLKGRGEVRDLARNGGAWSGRGGEARYWIASAHAEESTPVLCGAGLGEVASRPLKTETSPHSPRPGKGGEVDRGEVCETEEEPLDKPDEGEAAF